MYLVVDNIFISTLQLSSIRVKGQSFDLLDIFPSEDKNNFMESVFFKE